MEFLPDHLLIEIFEYLDAKNIKKVEKVSERWKQLIISSSRIMRKFTILSYEKRDDGLSFDDAISKPEDRRQQIIEQFDKLEDEMKQHSYRNIVIMFSDASLIPKEKYLDIVENCFTRIEKIKIMEPDNYLMMKTLSFISSTLWELKFDPLNDDNFDDFEPIILPKLKVCEVKKSIKILKYIRAPNLKTLMLKNCKNYDENLENFLKKSKKLKKLEFEAEFSLDLVSTAFSLEYLEITDIKSPNFMALFKSFIIPHQNTLKVLKITQRNSDCKEILAFVIENLRLETLDCCGRLDVHQNTEILDIMSENASIKNLYIAFNAYNRNSIVHLDHMDMELKIIKKCTKIENLKIDYLNGKFENFLKQIQGSDFKTFEIGFGNSVESTDIKYDKLDVLTVKRIAFETEIRSLVNFTAAFPNLKKLTFERLTIQNYADYFHQMFKTCRNLEEIEIKRLSGTAEDLYESLKSDDCHLKMLKIQVSKISEARKIEEIFKNASFNVQIFSISDQKRVEWDKFVNSYDLCIYDDDDF
ncbi:uncharacterized protein [Chironomus tepperi]|uniref:uncharacterized protein n=1 Tax=Chironomus tepperi TaxID=113505 RepID=UPI00391F6C26